MRGSVSMVVGLLVEFLLVSVLVVASSPRGRGNQRMLLLSKRREGFHLLAPVRQRSRVKEEKRPRPQPGVPILRQREKGGLKGARLFSEAEGMEGIIGKESYDEEYEGEEGRPVPSLLSPPPAFSDLPTETDLPLPPQVASEEETEEAEADDLFVMRPEWISIQKNSDGLGGATVVDSAGRRVVSPRAQASLEYVRGFRQWCPYIVAHQHRIMVISFPGGLAEHPSFSLLIRDLEFLHSLQVKLVIVMGSDPQIIRRLSAEGLEVRRGAGGRLIVDREAIKIVQEQAGYARSQVEAAMARSSSFGGGTRVNVVSGNHFYSTRPFGVVDGVDFGYSGKIRKVEPEAIKRLLDQHEVVLLSTLGYAPTGEVYHIPAAELASGVASELNASKVIFMTNGDKLVDSRNGKAISTLRLPDAKNLCDFWHEENGRMIHGGHEGAGRGVASSLTDSLPHSPSSSSSGQTHPTHTSFSTHPQDKIRLVSRAAAGRKRRNKSKSRQTRVEAFLSSLPSATDSEEESLPLQSQTSGEEKTIGQGSGGGARSAQNTAERAGAGEAMGGSEVEEGEEEEERHDEEEDGRMLDFSDEDLSANILSLCRLSVKALENGVDRAHLVDPLEGALLQELYTRDGSGTMICRDLYEGIRKASDVDVPAIMDLIQPLARQGILKARSFEEVDRAIGTYFVCLRDGMVVAVAQLTPFSNRMGEIGCFAVHPKYRKAGRGEIMLGYIERLAVRLGMERLFCLSTQTMQWFEDHGFVSSEVSELPPEKKEKYDWGRKSKVYVKDLGDERDIDEEEKMWHAPAPPPASIPWGTYG